MEFKSLFPALYTKYSKNIRPQMGWWSDSPNPSSGKSVSVQMLYVWGGGESSGLHFLEVITTKNNIKTQWYLKETIIQTKDQPVSRIKGTRYRELLVCYMEWRAFHSEKTVEMKNWN